MEGGSFIGEFEGFFLTCISGFLLFDPEVVANLSMGAMWNFGKGTGFF
jgi:hypothetical protein